MNMTNLKKYQAIAERKAEELVNSLIKNKIWRQKTSSKHE